MSKDQRIKELQFLLEEVEKAAIEFIEQDLDYKTFLVPHPALTAAFVLEQYIQIVLTKKQGAVEPKKYEPAKKDETQLAFEAEMSPELMKKQTFH